MKLAFYKKEKGKLLDKVIDLFTGRNGYSHVEIVFDGTHEINKEYNYSKANCFGISGRENIVRYKDIDLTNGHWDIYQVTGLFNTTIDDFQERRIKDKANKYLDLKYDYIGILFDWVIPVGFQLNNKWYCSELANMLIKRGHKRISPNGLSQKEYLTKIKI